MSITLLALICALTASGASAPGPGSLSSERAAARAAGIPLTPAEAVRPPLPAARNAAAIWAEAMRRRAELQKDSEIVEGPGLTDPLTRELTGRVRGAMQRSEWYLDLIRRASDLPGCDFRRDWGKGTGVLLPEYAPMRKAVRWLVVEARLLCADGETARAIDVLNRGFAIARHADSDGLIIGRLVALACEAIVLRGYENALYGDPALASRIRQDLTIHRALGDYRRSVRSEAVMACVELGRLRKRGTAALRELAGINDGDKSWQPPTEARSTPGFRRLVDANEAYVLRYYRRILQGSVDPGRALPIVRAQDRDLETRCARRDPSVIVANLFVGFGGDVLEKECARITRIDLLIAACTVLETRSRTGTIPANLAGTLPTIPVDLRTGRPVLYRAEGQGFVIYSSGVAGHFDGGAPATKPAPAEIVFRWPKPAYRP